MEKLQDSVFSIVKTTSLSPAVFSYLQPTEDQPDRAPLGGILNDTKHGWLALGPKLCVIDLRTGLKVAAWTFGTSISTFRTSITSVMELPTPLTNNSKQLVISLECEDITGIICIFHINGSQVLRCIQTDVVVTELSVCDQMPDGPFTCFDGLILAGTKSGEVIALDLNRACLIQALKDTMQGSDHLIRNELNMANITFLAVNSVPQIVRQRELAVENDDHLAILLNENSLVDGQYLFHNPDGTIRMKAKRDHIRVSTMQYIPQLGSLAVGFNFGAFQIWNLMTLELEYTSQVNVECLPVTHFAFQEPCDDPRAFCYLWVVYSVVDRFEDSDFPLAVMYSLTYKGKRMLSDTSHLYQEFLQSSIRFQVELSALEEVGLVGGRCVSCRAHCISSGLGDEGEDSKMNICQLVWESWGENCTSVAEYGLLLFDLDQWYKDQMPATTQLQSSAFVSCVNAGSALARDACRVLDVALAPSSVAPYSHATRLEQHFYPNSLQYTCVCLTTSDTSSLQTCGLQRALICTLQRLGAAALLAPARLHRACARAALAPIHSSEGAHDSAEEQRRYLLSVALEARLTGFLKRCAHDWATGSHAGAGCTLPFLVDWCWKRAIELKQYATELTAPLFTSSALPDRNVVRSLEHCVRQLTDLTSLLDSILTKCCNLVVPDALSSMEAQQLGIARATLYLQAVQWLLGAKLLPERNDVTSLPYPHAHAQHYYRNRRIKLHRLQDPSISDEQAANKSCSLLYIDQLIEHEFGGERIHELWRKGGDNHNGLYPPPSLYALLRLYLMPDIAEQHKHSLMLYLLVDYSMMCDADDARHESVIRRLMQFPTMFGLSNTAIKATQAFWHLDHRDFDFALDQLQCLTGNSLSEWQHSYVLSSLLAQKKTQGALQYLHARKPPPAHGLRGDGRSVRVNDHDKLSDWAACCNLYLARGLVYESLDVIRMCVQNAGSVEDKATVLNYFFKACRSTGQLSALLQVSLLPFEEKVFVKHLEECEDRDAGDILIMYYLQQARYLEAQQYNNKLKTSRARQKELASSLESILTSGLDRDGTRDTLVEVVCASLPTITAKVAHCVMNDFDAEPHVLVPKPMSVFVQAKSPMNTFTYKSSFIQDTIENASETWMHKPSFRRGMKRALKIEETPFLCTPKHNRSSILAQEQEGITPSKRPKLDLTGTPKTPKRPQSNLKISEKLNKEMQMLLEMPDVLTPPKWKIHDERPGTPQSILKVRRTEEREVAPSPVDSRYLDETDDELMETASVQTQYSDSKHLRFSIPGGSETSSTPSPPPATSPAPKDPHILESPPKRHASEESIKSRKSYKDSVRARGLSISINSSLSEDPNTSIESVADIPVTLINPRFSGEGKKLTRIDPDTKLLGASPKLVESTEREDGVLVGGRGIDDTVGDRVLRSEGKISPRTPMARPSIRVEGTSWAGRSRSQTPERMDSPIVTPAFVRRLNRSRSKTPDISPRSSPKLEAIEELPKLEKETEPHAANTKLAAPMMLRARSRSRTPERVDKMVRESPQLAAITESPKSESTEASSSSPSRRSLRSRSSSPKVEPAPEISKPESPRSLRRRSKTPEREKLISPIEKPARTRKSLSRMVLEYNAFSKTKSDADNTPTKTDLNAPTDKSLLSDEGNDSNIESTPIKNSRSLFSSSGFVDFSPIVNTSVLQSSIDTTFSDQEAKSTNRSAKSNLQKSLPGFVLSETSFEKSVLMSYQSSVADNTGSFQEEKVREVSKIVSFDAEKYGEGSTASNKSVLKDLSSLMTSDSDIEMKDDSNILTDAEKQAEEKAETQANVENKEKQRIVEIEREIHEIEGDISDEASEVSGESDEDSGDGMEEDSDGDEDEIVEGDSEEESDESDSDDDDDDKMPAIDVEDVISLCDSSDEVTSSSDNKLQIDEQSNPESIEESPNIDKDPKNAYETVKIVQIQVETPKETESNKNKDDSSMPNDSTVLDPLNQAGLSMLTDDNSLLSDHSDVQLNYSHDGKGEKADDTEKDVETEVKSVPEPQNQIKVDVTVKAVLEEDSKPTKPDLIVTGLDVVDAIKPSKTAVQENEPQIDVRFEVENEMEAEAVNKSQDKKKEEIKEKSGPKSRKRNQSTSSSKSGKDDETEVKTPMTRKRTKSSSSTKSDTKVTSEAKNDETPDKSETPSRSKTPSTEVRRILTRRASKELSESKDLDDSKDLDLSETATPKKRSTRSRSKTIDDNSSIASGSSTKSTRSKVCEDGEKSASRKSRKSIVTKPDLTVIPEVTAEESSKANEEIMNEYSSARRLTRHQHSMLSSWLHTSPSVGLATSNVTRAPALDKQPVDRIDEGSPNTDEIHKKESPDSITSDATRQRRSRMSRAASESKYTAKAAKPVRRGSVDVANLSELGSPSSPGRSRRACFNKACEALATPKGRRLSTDLKRETDSQAGSPGPSEGSAPVTPVRRTRRASSAHSNTSGASASARRPRKASVIEESKDEED